MPDQSTQTEFPKVENQKVKEILEIIAKIFEIQGQIDKTYWDFMDLTFSEELKKLYWHYKDELSKEAGKIYEFRG